METFAINICLIPDEHTSQICKELNKLDIGNYNKNVYEYIPHATLIMKTVNKEQLSLLIHQLSNISIPVAKTNVLDYYCKESPVGLWVGVTIEKNKFIQQIQEQVLSITENIENQNRNKNSYIVQDFFDEDITRPLRDESFHKNESQIHITFGKTDIRTAFEISDFPKEVVFKKLVIGQMGNYGSVRKVLFEIPL